MRVFRILVLLTGLLPLAALAAPDASLGRYHAIVIGNNNYSALPKLKTAVNDARGVAQLLHGQYGFDVELLIDASRADIIGALAKARGKLGPSDNLLVYFAGHGVLDSYAEEGYWLPVDADKSNPANWISNGDITNMVKALRARHVLVVADSCYSGTLVRAAPVKIKTAEERTAWIRRLAQKRSRTALVSGGLEPVIDAGGGQHSVFAKAFMAALNNNPDVLEGQSLFAAIRRPVALESDQTPEYSDIRRAGHDGGDFLFARLEARPTASAAAAPTTAAPASPAQGAVEFAYWDSIKNSTNPKAFEAYLAKFPFGNFADLARLKIDELKAAIKAASLVPKITLDGTWKGRADATCDDDDAQALDHLNIVVNVAGRQATGSFQANILGKIPFEGKVDAEGKLVVDSSVADFEGTLNAATGKGKGNWKAFSYGCRGSFTLSKAEEN